MRHKEKEVMYGGAGRGIYAKLLESCGGRKMELMIR